LTGSSSARFNEEICRGPLGNVKKWRDGTMALRWCAAGMLEADHQARAAPTAACTYRKLRAGRQARFNENVR